MTKGNLTGSAITWTAFANEGIMVLYDLRWMIICSIFLIFADLWWGCSESRKRFKETNKEEYKIRLSRAGRRTMNKFIDYMTYLLVGCAIGLAIMEPLELMSHTVTSALGLLLGCALELNSIYGHICYVKGKEKKFDFIEFFKALVFMKFRVLGNAFKAGEGKNRKNPKSKEGGRKNGTD